MQQSHQVEKNDFELKIKKLESENSKKLTNLQQQVSAKVGLIEMEKKKSYSELKKEEVLSQQIKKYENQIKGLEGNKVML